ncbi:hypothetical protein BS17DRAFT_108938 [Gyrodon lividus]|nr:hypothetical protein BS17DRAFT_108938 [Gyrodon lividus]
MPEPIKAINPLSALSLATVGIVIPSISSIKVPTTLATTVSPIPISKPPIADIATPVITPLASVVTPQDIASKSETPAIPASSSAENDPLKATKMHVVMRKMDQTYVPTDGSSNFKVKVPWSAAPEISSNNTGMGSAKQISGCTKMKPMLW